MTIKSLKITRPDDWHVHLREGNLLKAVINHSTRVNQRCIVMPNLNDPITTTLKGIDYIKKINLLSRIDTANEVEYYKNDGILKYVLRSML